MKVMDRSKTHPAREVAALAALAALAWLAAAATAAAQDAITRVSVDSTGVEGDGPSGDAAPAAISADGRHVAFGSSASNLVANDLNGVSDVFVHDRSTGATVRVSVDSAGVESNGASDRPSLSQDGRFVAFESTATNLVANDTNGASDVFVHDRDPDVNGIFDEGNGVTTRVSIRGVAIQANAGSFFASISGDGSRVAFTSDASNLVSNDLNGRRDVFVRNRSASTTIRASLSSAGVEGNGASDKPAISADGAIVAFESLATDLVSSDLNGVRDVFVRRLASGVTTRVSVDSSGAEGNAASSGPPALSSDGGVVAFQSDADNLVGGDGNGVSDVFAHDRSSGVTTRVSVDSSGAEGDGASFASPSLSADGVLVAFHGDATNLVAGDGNGLSDVFVHDRSTGETSGVSVDCAGASGNGASRFGALSGDGLLVAFSSEADDLVPNDANSVADVFVRDLAFVEVDASWSTYGAGFPGKKGIPNLAPSADPVLGTTFTIAIDNSAGIWTVAFLLAGLSQDSVPTHDGGTILVGDLFPIYAFPIAPGGDSLVADLPRDESLCGLAVYAQIIELDDAAQYGLSFTPGLALILGH
jgi:Tol biopolymer transport system component